MKPTVTLRRALTDPGLLGSILAGESWSAWRALLIASMGEPLNDAERATFTKLTGREREPLQRVEELWAIVGRRGGKSRGISTLASYIGGLCDHSDVLAPGERGVLLCIAPDQRQASVVLSYTAAAFDASPIMRQLVANQTADTLALSNGISIEVRAANFRRLRGPSYIGVILDEGAYLLADDTSANPDTEILAAVRPGLSTTGGPLIVITSPYAKKGEVYGTFKRHFGANGDPAILVAQAPSREMNPTLPQRVVDRALARDHAAASAEYLAQFRNDLESFIAREQVQACVEAGARERAPAPGTRYFSFCDPSGGSSDAMTCTVGHRDGDSIIVDAIREIPAPFNPDNAVEELATFLKSYKVSATVGDRYAAAWVTTAFAKHGIKYEHSELNRSELYLELLPRLNSRTIKLLDHPRAAAQICGLERRTARGGRDTIDHPPGSHDDLANAVAGLCGIAAKRSTYRLENLVDDNFNWANFWRREYVRTGGGWLRP
jgi:hypothetical protein